MTIFFLVLLLALSACIHSQLCSFPTDEEVTNLLQLTISLLESQEGEPGGTVSDVSPHFVCLATRGLDMYEGASIVANYTFTPDSGGPVEMRTDQFQLFCNLAAGVWNPTSDRLEDNLPSMPFDIELKDQCVSCFETAHPTLLYFDNITNCQECWPTCTSLGGGYCTQAGNSIDNCCPYFNNETGECVSDCTTIDPNFEPNEQFICAPPTVSCPAECIECDADGCCMACSSGYQTDNCTCAMMMSTTMPSPSPSCEAIEGCLTCILDPSGGTCCSGCDGENGFTLDDCDCFRVMSSTIPSPSPSCEALEGCITCALDVSGRTCCSECDNENGFNLDGCGCDRTNDEAISGLSPTTVAGVAVGIVVLFIAVIIIVVVIFLVIIYRAKRASKPYHNERVTMNRYSTHDSIHEEEGGYATVPYVVSMTNEIPTDHATPTKKTIHNEGDDEYMSMSDDAPALPDRTNTSKSIRSNNIYDNDDDIEFMKKNKASVSGELQSEKDRTSTSKSMRSDGIYDNDDEIEFTEKNKARVSGELQSKEKSDEFLHTNPNMQKRTLDDRNDNDDSGYVAMVPIAEGSEVTHDQSHP